MSSSIKTRKAYKPNWDKIHQDFGIGIGTKWKEMEIEVNPEATDICLDCNEFKKELEEGKQICECGKIYLVLDKGPEWRFYTEKAEPDSSRCGMPIHPLLPESSFVCSILPSGKISEQMYRLKQKNNELSDTHRETMLYKQFQYIQSMGLAEKINKDACILYKNYIENNKKHLRKDNRDGIVTGAVYRALEENEVPRSTQEVADIFHVPVSVVMNGYKKIPAPLTRQSITPFSFIARYCYQMKLPEIYSKLCEFICIKIYQEKQMMEYAPQSVAASIVYWIGYGIAHLPLNKKKVAEELHVSVVTINKCCHKLDMLREELIPSAFINTPPI
jgi:transcription initiation factor TFIIIB Brf1 subunit/transcription initiation factor TFIIB